MVVEREPSFSRGDLNETQLRMLKQNDVPGLLPMEVEECDGRIALRYRLTGTRMLSEALRSAHWTMGEMMGALCRLAEALEECRLYLLDADRIRLQDEYIFVGQDWHDLRFTYLPIDMPTLYRSDDLERLIVRWMMRVKEPEGQALQQVLRLVASPGFVPSALSRYVKSFLADSRGKGIAAEPALPPFRTGPTEPEPPPRGKPEPKPEAAKASRSWDLLKPASGDLQPLSELWGESFDGRPSTVAPGTDAKEEKAGESDLGGWRLRVGCSCAIVLAVVWKYAYLDHPSRPMLFAAIGVTLAAGACLLLLWNGWPKKRGEAGDDRSDPDVRAIEEAFAEIAEEPANRDRWFSAGTEREKMPPLFAPEPAAREPLGAERDEEAGTTWLDSRADRTALLNRNETPAGGGYCLVWKAKGDGCRIPLEGQSFVIGRSAEAAQHVDDTAGISRVHVELVRISEQWKVKDLGSRNGTRLNDSSLAPYELYALQEGDCLTLAQSRYVFQVEER